LCQCRRRRRVVGRLILCIVFVPYLENILQLQAVAVPSHKGDVLIAFGFAFLVLCLLQHDMIYHNLLFFVFISCKNLFPEIE
jgi:hypothetical protein